MSLSPRIPDGKIMTVTKDEYLDLLIHRSARRHQANGLRGIALKSRVRGDYPQAKKDAEETFGPEAKDALGRVVGPKESWTMFLDPEDARFLEALRKGEVSR
jgi:hypothetical protein